MSQTLLTLNAGSSSVKFGLYDLDANQLRELVHGQVEGINVEPHFVMKGAAGEKITDQRWDKGQGPANHADCLKLFLDWLSANKAGTEIVAVGHRVVHGGPDYSAPVKIDGEVRAALDRFVKLAPLHQPHNLACVDAAQQSFPQAIQVACFDTAFHRQHPWINDTFALPREFFDKGVRRYGFHGLSYEYVSQKLVEIAPYHAAGRVVVAHLGSGASMCGIRNGRSIASTMGFTALEGLPMGTRTGQLDPGVVLHMLQEFGMSIKEVTDTLYKKSGLLGLSGISNDMRVLEQAGTIEADQAIEYFDNYVRRELGALATMIGGIDALVFTAGIGENSWKVRQRVCDGLEWMGIEIDDLRNHKSEQIISSDRSRVRVFVIPTSEEAMIAQHTAEILTGQAIKQAA